MKKEYKSKNKFIIAVNLFLIFCLMTVAVYAWFASSSDNKVDAYDIQVQSDSDLQLSFDGETWGGSLDLANLENADGTKVLDTMKFVEVTSDGTGFFIPQLIQNTGYASVNAAGEWKNATANVDYLNFTVYMRSKEKLKVYLSSDSQASPSSSVYSGAGCGNPSTYASGANSFSKDCVVGALRVAYDDAEGRRWIWITNPNFHLTNNVGASDYSMDVDAVFGGYSNGTYPLAQNNPYYWNNPYTHYSYVLNGNKITSNSTKPQIYSYTQTELPDTVTTMPTTDQSSLLTTLTLNNTTGMYEGQATFSVWIEGCDTEARRALVDGKFNLSLVLDGFGTQ